jgi:Svf1-like C-terminal lipocalin-like domain/Svf1-like N-terminal lipocalin domain
MSGWGSWLSGDTSATDAKPNFRAVTDRAQDALFGPLEAKDLEWTCAGGFATETQTWYTVMQDGSWATSQIIHSSIGLWYPQVQITFKYFNPKTGEKVWKSVNVSKFVTPAPAGSGRDKSKVYDKRSCKGEQFSVLFDTLPDGSESYTIEANMDTDLQVSYTFKRPSKSAGWKLGSGDEGGKSYFGANPSTPDGYVVHRFWPHAVSDGHIIHKGQAIDAKGAGMFVHAIQGMRPNLVASRWNFGNFQSKYGSDENVAAVMMEFTTTSDYGGPIGSRTVKDEATGNAVRKREPIVVTIGSVTVDGELVAVTGASRGLQAPEAEPSKGSETRVYHLNTVHDPETGYTVPQSMKFKWQGPQLIEGKASKDLVNAEVSVDLKGLIEKVDILGEIPYMVRKMVNYVAGTKPYLHQYLNPATLKITLPSKELNVEGSLFCEATFISEV